MSFTRLGTARGGEAKVPIATEAPEDADELAATAEADGLVVSPSISPNTIPTTAVRTLRALIILAPKERRQLEYNDIN